MRPLQQRLLKPDPTTMLDWNLSLNSNLNLSRFLAEARWSIRSNLPWMLAREAYRQGRLAWSEPWANRETWGPGDWPAGLPWPRRRC